MRPGRSIAARSASSAAPRSPVASTPRCRSATGRCRAARRDGARRGSRRRQKWYQTAMNIGSSGSVMANRYNYYDLDPTYRNAFGLPLMRMTFDYKENEHKMGRHAAQLVNDIAKSMNPTTFNPATARTEPWTV